LQGARLANFIASAARSIYYTPSPLEDSQLLSMAPRLKEESDTIINAITNIAILTIVRRPALLHQKIRRDHGHHQSGRHYR
jgi:hypothetical protein